MYDLVRNSFTAAIAQWRLMSREFVRVAAAVQSQLDQAGIEQQEKDKLQLDKERLDDLVALINEGKPGDAGNPPMTSILKSHAALLERMEQPTTGPKGAAGDRLQEIFNEADAEHTRSSEVWLEIVERFEERFPSLGESVAVKACREQLDDLGVFIRRRQQDLLEVSSLVGERANIRQMRGSVEALGAYPILTTEYGTGGGFGGSGGSSTGTSLGPNRIVDSTIRGVLGRNARRNDPRSFTAALKQSFAITEFEGRTEVAWQPHSFVGHADLGGGVTGAQASLFNSASVGLDNILPLLDGLYPLRADADDEDSYAMRAIVRAELIGLVEELKLEGGPRVARVNSLFKQLLDSPSHIEQLKSEFGLDENRINTLDEELNVSNFIALNDYVKSLRTSWETFETQFLGKDLGSRLVLLSRSLSVASEAVDEVIAAMDSVFVGPAERQVASFLAKDLSPVVVDELLSWISTFTTEEAPNLIQSGGRRGVQSIIPTAILLEDQIDGLLDCIYTDPSIPTGMRHPRVVNPLKELATYLDQIRRFAEDVSLPLRNGK